MIELQSLTTRLMVICMGSGSQAHEEEESNGCVHCPGPRRESQNKA